MKIRLFNIVFSWDFLLAACICVLSIVVLAPQISNELGKDLYGVGISVLSIVFSVYFAALAIIISSSDDEFVRFLEEIGDYSRLIATFRYTIGALFVALIYSIAMYIFTSVWLNDQITAQPKWFLVTFAFLFPYSLFAAVSVTNDAIQYAKSRSDFLMKTRRKNRH
jgi:hypothetical protein